MNRNEKSEAVKQTFFCIILLHEKTINFYKNMAI